MKSELQIKRMFSKIRKVLLSRRLKSENELELLRTAQQSLYWVLESMSMNPYEYYVKFHKAKK